MHLHEHPWQLVAPSRVPWAQHWCFLEGREVDELRVHDTSQYWIIQRARRRCGHPGGALALRFWPDLGRQAGSDDDRLRKASHCPLRHYVNRVFDSTGGRLDHT